MLILAFSIFAVLFAAAATVVTVLLIRQAKKSQQMIDRMIQDKVTELDNLGNVGEMIAKWKEGLG